MTTLVKICPSIVGSKDEVVSFLQAKGLLHQQKRCSNCASAMNLQKRRDIVSVGGTWKQHGHTSQFGAGAAIS